MANGDDKNWIRICVAVDGFRVRYGRWPTGVRLPPTYFENVVGHVLSPQGFAFVSNFLAIISDDELSERAAIIAIGESGSEFCYGEEANSNGPPEPLAYDFFGPAVLRDQLGNGLEYTKLHDAKGNLVWMGEGLQKDTIPLTASQKGTHTSLTEFLSQPKNAHSEQGNPVVTCNALYKAVENFNCYLTVAQAITLARNLLQKAQLIVDEKLDDAVVHLWNKGKANEKLYCGLNQGRKGPRKNSKSNDS